MFCTCKKRMLLNEFNFFSLCNFLNYPLRLRYFCTINNMICKIISMASCSGLSVMAPLHQMVSISSLYLMKIVTCQQMSIHSLNCRIVYNPPIIRLRQALATVISNVFFAWRIPLTFNLKSGIHT